MPYSASVVNVMIASPGDVAHERRYARDAIHEWNSIHAGSRRLVLLPLSWETHASPSMGRRAQQVINDQVLGRCDLLVAVFWTRLGSPTGESQSGTVEEIERHLAEGKPAMLYFSNAPVRPDSVDAAQYKALIDFRKDCESRGLIETYDSVAEFRTKFARQLAHIIQEEFSATAAQLEVNAEQLAVQPGRPVLSDEAVRLLLAASEGDDGDILCITDSGGLTVQANRQILFDGGRARDEAKWRAAVQELEETGLIDDRGHKGEVFAVTHRGYEIADLARQEQE